MTILNMTNLIKILNMTRKQDWESNSIQPGKDQEAQTGFHEFSAVLSRSNEGLLLSNFFLNLPTHAMFCIDPGNIEFGPI